MARTQVEMFKQILDVFGDENSPYFEQDIADMCRKKIAAADKSSSDTARKLELVRSYIKKYVTEDEQRSAKEIAVEMTEDTGERWTPQGAGFYLRKLVTEGCVEECGKNPKTYIFVGAE